MNKSGFLQKAGSTSPFLSESKILNGIAEKNKAIVFVTKTLASFHSKCTDVFKIIDTAKFAKVTLIEIQDDETIHTEEIASKSIDTPKLINLINRRFGEYTGFCFVVNSGVKFLYQDGKINEEVESCLETTKQMQSKLGALFPVSDLERVFNHFKVDCKCNKDYYEQFFDTTNNKVLEHVKEQDLRNALLEYLLGKMKGEVSIEFCTDYCNDEESVDIYLNDGNERAIIEVKYSLLKKYYLGKTRYDFKTRIKDGYLQIDKYAQHLSKDHRMVEYAYLYMFYMNDRSEHNLYLVIEDVISSTAVTVDLKSVFQKVILNDMKEWIVT